MKRESLVWGVVVLMVMGAFSALPLYPPAVAQQPPTLIYGVNSGAARPILVDASGNLNLSTVDPCAAPNVTKLSAVLAVTADATVVALTAGQTIYVCGYGATVEGTAPTYRFQSGTGTACATSTDQLSGVFLPTVGSFQTVGWGGSTVFTASSAEDLCVDVGGTSPSVQGIITYVKQ